jgi:hypothetical protein
VLKLVGIGPFETGTIEYKCHDGSISAVMVTLNASPALTVSGTWVIVKVTGDGIFTCAYNEKGDSAYSAIPRIIMTLKKLLYVIRI